MPLQDEAHCRQFTFWDKAFLLIAVTTAVSAVVLTAFYWALIHKKKDGIKIDSVFKYGANVVVILLDLLLSRIPIVTYHFQVGQK